jgi:chemotaxis protein MotA
LLKEMVLEGVAGIVEGLNPTLIRLKLESYNRDSEKPKKPKPATAAQAAAKPGMTPRPVGKPQPAAAASAGAKT